MPTSGFFGFLWRFNAVMIAAAAIAVVILAGFLGLSLFSPFYLYGGHTTATNLVGGPAQAPQKEIDYFLGVGVPLEGTGIVAFYLSRSSGGGSSLSSRRYEGAETANVCWS